MSTPAPPAPTLATATEALCRNCGHPAPARYCPECGQGTADRRMSLRRLIASALEDELSISSALPQTLRLLLFRPGALTREYLAGRRARYVPPLRLYVVASFIFFLVASMRGDGSPVRVSTDGEPQAAVHVSGLEELENGARIPFLTEAAQQRFVQRLRIMADSGEGGLDRQIRRAFAERVPLAVFLLVPISAALLMLGYAGTRRFYVEHLVFALHLHAFVFLTFTARTLASGLGWPARLLSLWLLVYLVLALRRVYERSIAGTLLRLAFVAPAYLLVLSATLLGLLLFTVFTIPL